MNNDRFKFRVAVKQADGSFKVFDVVNATFQKDAILVRYRDETLPQCDFGCVINGTDTILLQCTGLKDCKRRLIYEGDIVYIAGVGNCIVEYSPGDLMMFFLRIEDKEDFSLQDAFEGTTECRIIGNIYQNKELLG